MDEFSYERIFGTDGFDDEEEDSKTPIDIAIEQELNEKKRESIELELVVKNLNREIEKLVIERDEKAARLKNIQGVIGELSLKGKKGKVLPKNMKEIQRIKEESEN